MKRFDTFAASRCACGLLETVGRTPHSHPYPLPSPRWAMEGDFIWSRVLRPRANMTAAWLRHDALRASCLPASASVSVSVSVSVSAFLSHHPSGWAEERSRKRIRASYCLRRSRVRARPRFRRAPQVARSEAEGSRPSGRLSFGYFSLAKQRQSASPAGARPGLSEDPLKR